MKTLLAADAGDDRKPAPVAADGWLIAVRSIAVVAFGLSAYLLWGSLTGEGLPGCGLESGCATVMKTRWAYLLRVPVSLPALLTYAAVIAATSLLTRAPSARVRRLVGDFLLCASVVLIGVAIWFVGLQLLVIRAICPFCMAAHGCGLVLGTLILLRTRAGSATQVDAGPSFVRAWPVLVGLAGVVVLVTGQLVDQPKLYAVDSAARLAARKTPRVFQLHGGLFQLDLNAVPLLGSSAAPCVIVHLFDYSCPHCRQLHPILVDLYRSLSNRVAIVSLVVPLATNCNPVLKRPIPLHTNACEYAHAGLAVWRANPSLLPAFEEWIFTPNRPPAPEEVRRYAMQLVGTNNFQDALRDPTLTAQLERNISLYATNYYRFRKSTLPELMIGTNIVSGVVRSREDLYRLITNQFNL